MQISSFRVAMRIGAAAGLFAVAGFAQANSTDAAFTDVADSVAFDGFNALTSSRITTAQLVAGIASNVAGSDGGAVLARTSGAHYPASAGIYSFTTGSTFTVNVADAAEGLTSIVFQSFVNVDTSQNVFGLLSPTTLPTLNFNGGTQAIAATSLVTQNLGYTDFFTGEFVESNPNNPNYALFTWDLSAIDVPIESFKLNFGLDVHSNALAFQLDQAVAAVPEPQTYALLLGGLGVVGFIARRRQSNRAV